MLLACTDYEKNNTNNEIDSLNIDLSNPYFHEIYNLGDSYFINDVTVHKHDASTTETEYNLSQSDIDINVVSELLGIECTNSTINDTVIVKKNYDYIIDFKISNQDKNRPFSVSIGESYLLVSLVSETEMIIKHEISKENYENLLNLLRK